MMPYTHTCALCSKGITSALGGSFNTCIYKPSDGSPQLKTGEALAMLGIRISDDNLGHDSIPWSCAICYRRLRSVMNNIYTLREHASTSVRCIVDPLPKIQPPRSIDFGTPAATQRVSDALQLAQVEGKKIVIVPARIGGKNARAIRVTDNVNNVPTDVPATETSLEPCRSSSLDMNNLCAKTSVACQTETIQRTDEANQGRIHLNEVYGPELKSPPPNFVPKKGHVCLCVLLNKGNFNACMNQLIPYSDCDEINENYLIKMEQSLAQVLKWCTIRLKDIEIWKCYVLQDFIQECDQIYKYPPADQMDHAITTNTADIDVEVLFTMAQHFNITTKELLKKLLDINQQECRRDKPPEPSGSTKASTSSFTNFPDEQESQLIEMDSVQFPEPQT